MAELISSTLESTVSKMRLSKLGPASNMTSNPGLPPLEHEFKRLYFDDPEQSERSSSEWHEMISAPLFTNSVLQQINNHTGRNENKKHDHANQ